MLLVIVFVLGILNFAMHRAVMESRHGIVGAIRARAPHVARIALVLEFCVLAIALGLVGVDRPGWGIAYCIYSIANAITAWAILARRI